MSTSPAAGSSPSPLAEQLADVLAEAARDKLAQVLEYARSAFSAVDLFGAGPTSHSEAMVSRCETAIETYRAAGKRVPKQTEAELRSWQQHARIARERDRRHAERQAAWPGCVCLGFGGRHPHQGLAIVSPDGRTLADPTVEVYRDLCPCPLGEAARARIEAARADLLRDDQQRKLHKLWSDLKLPELPADVSLEAHPDRVKIALVERWYGGEFKPGLLIAGPNQRGKTVTAYLLAERAVQEGQGTLAMTVPDLLGRLKDTFDHDRRLAADPDHPPQTTHEQLIASLQTVPLLVLDDLGAEQMTDYVETALYRVLDARVVGRHRTIITTNLPGEHLATRLGPRLYSRIANLCNRVVFKGPVLGPARGGLDDLEDLADGSVV